MGIYDCETEQGKLSTRSYKCQIRQFLVYTRGSILNQRTGWGESDNRIICWDLQYQDTSISRYPRRRSINCQDYVQSYQAVLIMTNFYVHRHGSFLQTLVFADEFVMGPSREADAAPRYKYRIVIFYRDIILFYFIFYSIDIITVYYENNFNFTFKSSHLSFILGSQIGVYKN